MEFNFLHIWQSMGLLNKLISGSLLLMGLACLTVFFDRVILFVRLSRRSSDFREEAVPHLEAGDFAAAAEAAVRYEGSHIAEVVGAAVKGFAAAGADESPRERAEREVMWFHKSFGVQIRKGMSLLASVGSVAPFIGLLGTVIGIIVAFQGIAASGSGGISSVAVGIAEALVETALGLLVAIPAVLMFNVLTTRIEKIETELIQYAGRVVDMLERNGHGLRAEQRRAA